MMAQHYKAIFFDAGGTLLYPYPSVGHIYQEVGARSGCPATADQIQQRFYECWKRQEGLAKLTSRSDEKIEREWWRHLVCEIFSQFGVIESFEDLFQELYDIFAGPGAWRLFPEVREVLDQLKRRGHRLAVISNWDSRLFRLCESLELTSYFDFILASAVVGASKPGPKIFEEALKRSGMEPRQTVHVGDSFEDDVKGAHALGIATILIDREGHHDDVNNPPMRKIKALSELLSWRNRKQGAGSKE